MQLKDWVPLWHALPELWPGEGIRAEAPEASVLQRLRACAVSCSRTPALLLWLLRCLAGPMCPGRAIRAEAPGVGAPRVSLGI